MLDAKSNEAQIWEWIFSFVFRCSLIISLISLYNQHDDSCQQAWTSSSCRRSRPCFYRPQDYSTGARRSICVDAQTRYCTSLDHTCNHLCHFMSSLKWPQTRGHDLSKRASSLFLESLLLVFGDEFLPVVQNSQHACIFHLGRFSDICWGRLTATEVVPGHSG
jgi:hypothetical protein